MRRVSVKVVDLALGQLRVWRNHGFDVSVSVNLSASDLRTMSVVDVVRDALHRHRVPGDRLELEVTETAVLSSPERAVEVLTALRALGVRIAIDDFGTGYSSLTYLKRLRPDRLKIDRSFVDSIVHDATDAQIVSSLITLAHGLSMEVTAEGVETQEHWDLLAALGSDLVQGYHLSRPADDVAATAWLAARTPGEPAAAVG
jgi:diguanylate cyclase